MKVQISEEDRNLQNFRLMALFLYPSIIFFLGIYFFTEIASYKIKILFSENIIFSILCFSLVVFLRPIRRLSFIPAPVYLILALKVFIEISYYFLYNSSISASTIFILLETNVSEVYEFLISYFSSFHYILIIILLIPLLFVRRLFLMSPNNISPRTLFLLIPVFLISIVLYQYKGMNNYNIYAVGVNSFYEYKEQTSLYDEIGLHEPKGNFAGVVQTKTNERQIYVLVIGESTTRHKMQIYGYPRNTNPLLSSIKNNLLIYQDVISPHTHTIESLTKILTLNRTANEIETNVGSLVQLMNQAKFRTYWLSNQRPVGWNENFITKIAEASNRTLFINDQADFLETPYDGELLSHLDRVLKEDFEKAFIVVHLLGAHNKYSNRYPPSYDYFTGVAPIASSLEPRDLEVINDYDNAVRYNDEFLFQLVQKLKKEDASSFMLYLSDHGEDVFQVNTSASHTENNGTKPMYDVPFILWMSEKYYRKESLDIDVHRKYMLDDFIHSFSDLVGVRFNNYRPDRSIFNRAFEPKIRLIRQEIEYDFIFTP